MAAESDGTALGVRGGEREAEYGHDVPAQALPEQDQADRKADSRDDNRDEISENRST